MRVTNIKGDIPQQCNICLELLELYTLWKSDPVNHDNRGGNYVVETGNEIESPSGLRTDQNAEFIAL